MSRTWRRRLGALPHGGLLLSTLLLSALLLSALLLGVTGCDAFDAPSAAPPLNEPPLSAVAALRGGADDGLEENSFARALGPVPFEFPRDHGPHEDFAIEWWYFTGNLDTVDARHFGYQLTFFRTALAPPDEDSPDGNSSDAEDVRPSDSRWATDQIYFAHFALTDVTGARFASAERVSRGAAGLAGARAVPFSVWVLDWQATRVESESAATSVFPLRLKARALDAEGRPFAIDLTLEAGKPRVLHGDAGWSKKGSAPGNASYYVSRTRMPTSGRITTADGEHSVTGASWLDREWSTSVLEPGQIGWDWFSLQLADGRELMVFELRRDDGTIDSASHGTWIEAADPAADTARVTHLDSASFTITVLDHWTSPRGTRYPSKWRLEVPRPTEGSTGIDVIVEPWIADQELDVSFRYFEGAVRVRSHDGRDLGDGYVELVGYAESPSEASLE